MKERIDGSVCLAKKCCACCIDSQMRLTPAEYEFMKMGGSRLTKRSGPAGLWDISNYLAEPDDGKTGYGMDGACGYLQNGPCNAYEDPRRPQTCADTDPGSIGCTSCRGAQGLKPINLIWSDGYD